MKKKELAGQRFGRLVAVSPVSVFRGDRRRVLWHCVCDCGNETDVECSRLLASTKSCGCIQREFAAQLNYKHGGSVGYKECREYGSWQGAKSRCNNPKDHKYASYGGRGIRMCPEWEGDYARFLSDMGPCPDGKTLDRKDVNGNYDAENCRWATALEQMCNTRANVWITFGGKTLTMSQWARELKVDYKLFHSWYRYQKHSMTTIKRMARLRNGRI